MINFSLGQKHNFSKTCFGPLLEALFLNEGFDVLNEGVPSHHDNSFDIIMTEIGGLG